MSFTIDHKPADIVKIFPKASDLFKENRIDFCCGGDRALKVQIAEQNLDENMIMTELNTAYGYWKKEDHEVTDWEQLSLSELVDHIVHTHHAFLEEELVPLGQFVTKIYRVHGENHPELKELYRLYHAFKMEMEEHTIKEDNEVFPLIKQYELQPSDELLERIRIANGGLEDEHDATGDLLKQIRNVTNDFTPPADACTSYRITFQRLRDIEADTFQHVHLENNILFKKL